MTANPDDDQRQARISDLRRFLELVRPYMTGPADERISAVYARMPAAKAAEARAIRARVGLGRLRENPATTAARQQGLLQLAGLEGILRGIIDRPHYLVDGGRVVTDPATGNPVPDEEPARQARARLRELGQLRARLTGLPDDGNDTSSAS